MYSFVKSFSICLVFAANFKAVNSNNDTILSADQDIFKVTIYDTSGRLVHRGTQKVFEKVSVNSHLCTMTQPNPHVIVYHHYSSFHQTTLYKVCCLASICKKMPSFDPFNRYGKAESKKNIANNDEGYHDLTNLMGLFTIIFIACVILFPCYYILYARHRDLKAWTEPSDKLEPALFELAETPLSSRVCYGVGSAYPVTGEHQLIDYCRMLVARGMYEDAMQRNEVNKTMEVNRAKAGKGVEIKVVNKINSTSTFFFHLEAQGMGHLAHPLNRIQRLGIINCLFDCLMSHGPYKFPFSVSQLIDTFERARGIFAEDQPCVELELPVAVIGDIRGRYIDLHRWIQTVGLPYGKRILFLGGLVEPEDSEYEEYSLECLVFVAAMKIAYPRYVFLLRGASEAVVTFQPRFGYQYDAAILNAARQMCAVLPVAALIDKNQLAVPSGFSHQLIHDPNCFSTISRPIKSDAMPLLVRYLLFGQPTATMKIFEHNEHLGTYTYGLQAVYDLCAKRKFKRIIRSRNKLKINPLILCDEKFVSIYSVTMEEVPGVAMYIDKNFGTVYLCLAQQKSALKFPEKVEVKKQVVKHLLKKYLGVKKRNIRVDK